MRPLLAALSVACLLALTAGPAPAGPAAPDSGAAAGKAHRKHAHDPFAFPKRIQLTADQQAKLDALKKQYGTKLEAAHARIETVLTPEQRKAAAAARHQAAAEGKKGKALHEAVLTALKLPADEQAKVQEAFAAEASLRKEIHRQKLALLTDAQKAELKRRRAASE
jgi:hypothetical protein